MNEELIKEVVTAANLYYNGSETNMDDESYDKLLKQVKEEDPSFNIFDHVNLDDSNRVSHYTHFITPDFKIEFHSIEEFVSTLTGEEYITPKWDGSSIRAYYKNGKLFDIVTRNDEYTGIRQLNKLRNKVPAIVDESVSSIDFESLCTIEDFGIASRSKANGLINSKYKYDEVQDKLTLIPFYVETTKCIDYVERMKLGGFIPNVDYILLTIGTLPEYTNKQIEFKGKHYPIDGFAMYFKDKVNFQLRKHYATEAIQTVVTDIEWNMSDKFMFVPKLRVEPIYIEGRKIQRCTANGYQELARKKCGIGSVITIVLAKSVIPQVGDVIVPSEDYALDKKCPYCGADMQIDGTKARCSNIKCSHIYNYTAANVIKYMLNEGVEYQSVVNKYISDKSVLEEIRNNNYDKLNLDCEFGDLVARTAIIERLSDSKREAFRNFINSESRKQPYRLIYPEGVLTWKQIAAYEYLILLYDEIFQVLFGDRYNDGTKL